MHASWRSLWFLVVPGVSIPLACAALGAEPAAGKTVFVTACEHFAFLRAKVPEGLGGPARQAAKSWHVSLHVAADGTAYVLDAENCQVYRVQQGTVRVLAGDGIRGFRDGPADRARFDFGVGSYQDADIKGDAKGNIYVSEGLPGRLRKIFRDADGIWQVTTLSGGGTRMPRKGESIPARQMKFGCASRFAVTPEGTVYFATYSGVYRIEQGEATLVAGVEDLPPELRRNVHDWHVGGSHITPDGWFYWMPGGGPNLLRLNVRTGKAEKFAGVDKVVQGLDGPTLLETGFHTVFIAYSPDASVMFTGGGDEGILRRIAGGKAAHLQKDGTFLPGGKKDGWRLYSPLCLDSQGRLYTETGVYAWGGFVARVTFDKRATFEKRAAFDKAGPHPSPLPEGEGRAHRDNRVLRRQPAGAFGAGVYLVAWCDGSRQADRPTADIYCARVDAKSGKFLDPEGIRVCSAPDLQEWPAVAFDGTNFLVVWQDFRSGKHYSIYAARVTPAGKLLDENGFAVAAGSWNQARPAVAFAGGNYLVVWMDAREYPVYGIYGARVSPSGKVLDPDGLPLDVEDAAKIAKIRPPAPQWMGDRDYWWQHLASRYLPAVASNGKKCLVVYQREYPFAESGRPKPCAVLVDPAEGRVEAGPMQLPGGAYDTLAACATPRGWAVVLGDHAEGWGLAARLAVVRLDDQLQTRDAFAKVHSKDPDNLPVERLEESLMPKGAETLNPGKGALSFWRPAAAWDGRHVAVAMDFGWRERRDANAITYVIAGNGVALDGARFVEPKCIVVATTTRADQAVANPALIAGPSGQVLLLYEHDESLDRQTIAARMLPEPQSAN